MEVLLNKFLG